MVNQAPLSDKEIDDLFIHVEPPAPNTFEVALVLGGTVSAGAFTAGAVDFLIEALDAWTTLRDKRDPSAPQHKTLLKVITGTSGGGVNAAIAARALAFEYPHVVRSTPVSEGGIGNPFYDVWVNRLTLSGFLDVSDINTKNFASILNGKPIDDGAAFIAGFTSGTLRPRSYLAEPLRVILTLTNLRGIPYKTVFGDGSLTETFVDHADYARFALVYPGRALANPRPDEFVVGFDNARLPQAVDWATFSLFARATAAFPLGFPPRALVRPTEHYRYRVVILPPDEQDGSSRVVGRLPDWASLATVGTTDPPADYHFLTVDGGATDNEPIELARTALAGVLGRNPRDGKRANRAVLLIDPFAGKADLGPSAAGPLTSTVGAIVSTFTEQTRYSSADVLLAADKDVFSRFMITPRRDGMTGGDAIASDGLGAFLGFASPAFMRHDYLLGRANAQAFLKSVFVLPENNDVFVGMWSDGQKQDHEVIVDGERFLPIVPLLGDAAVTEATEAWPRHALDPTIYRDAIEGRFKAIVEYEGSGGLVSSTVSWLLAHVGEDKVGDFAINAMNKALQDSGLS